MFGQQGAHQRRECRVPPRVPKPWLPTTPQPQTAASILCRSFLVSLQGPDRPTCKAGCKLASGKRSFTGPSAQNKGRREMVCNKPQNTRGYDILSQMLSACGYVHWWR